MWLQAIWLFAALGSLGCPLLEPQQAWHPRHLALSTGHGAPTAVQLMWVAPSKGWVRPGRESSRLGRW